MSIPPINVSFGYKHLLKTAFKEDRLPIIHDFYDGSILSKDTVTIEHLQPHSKGGKTTLSNIVLTSLFNNMKRGNKDIRDFIDIENAKKYIEDVRKINIKGINGESYAQSLINRLKSLGVKL